MARIHYWAFLQDDTGAPLVGANVTIFLANSTEPAYIYTDEIKGSAINKAPQLKSNTEGFFQFWIGDLSENFGYPSTQKFKLFYERIGIASGVIDYVEIFAPTLPVDETDNNAEKNKSVSNLLAKGWEEHRLSKAWVIHGIEEYNREEDDYKKNKLVSNRLGNFWQNHRLFTFNLNSPIAEDPEEKAPWEDPTSEYYGAHGLQAIQITGLNADDTIYNRLMCNALGQKWDEHVEFSFKNPIVGRPAHDLYPLNFADLTPPGINATPEEIEEYTKSNKLVSNQIIKTIFNNLTNKPTVLIKEVKAHQWKKSMYNEGFYVSITHKLDTESFSITCFRQTDRMLENGLLTRSKSKFNPAEVYVEDRSTITIYINDDPVDVEVVIMGISSQIIGSEEL